MSQSLSLILHGTPVIRKSDHSRWFLVWGEQRLFKPSFKLRGRLPKVLKHPYAISSENVKDIINALSESLMLDAPEHNLEEGEAVLTLPVVKGTPLPSQQLITDLAGEPGLTDVKVSAVYLSTLDAVALLSAIPLSRQTDILPCEVGADILFWSAVAKLAFYLISQHKFIPTLREEEKDEFSAFWEPVLEDPSDAEKLKRLSKAMPDACRCVRSASMIMSSQKSRKSVKAQCDLPDPHPGYLALDFLKNGVDQWIRNRSGKTLRSNIPGKLGDKSIAKWLEELTTPVGRFQSPDLEDDLKKLSASLAEWRGGVAGPGAQPGKFRTCFRLEPPEGDEARASALPKEGSRWSLRYFLQAVDDPSLLVPADMIWRERRATLRYLNRELESPQERLLGGLGMASRMFPPIEQSLRQARPDACFLELEEAYQFLSEASLLLQQSGFGVLAPPWWTEKKSPLKARVSVSTPGTDGAGFLSLDRIVQYDWQLALGENLLTREELEYLAKLKVPLVRVRGEWVMLRPEDIESAMNFFKKYGESGEISLRDAVRLSLNESPELEGVQLESIETPDWFDSMLKGLKGGSLKQLRQPKEFEGKLRPYQLRGMSWLAFMRQWGLGACLADDMGLGKTVEVIAFLLRERKQRGDKSRPNLLICPTSVVGNWQREVARFGPPLEVMVHHGSDRLAGEEFTKSIMEHDLVVTSYGLALRDSEELAAAEWKGVILDEAQNIKNPLSKTARAVRSFKSEYRFALTGTPVENRLMELWSIMEFLNPGYLGSQKSFHQRSVLPIERYADERATDELKSVVNPFILRRLKTDSNIISDLPEKLEMKVYCNLTREQVTLYEAIVKDMMQQFEENEEQEQMSQIKRRGMVLAGLTKLKQLCNHPALFLHDQSDLEGRSGKLQRLTEMLEEVIAEGDKALVFSQFTEMGEALQEYLAGKFRCDVLFLHGGVPQKRRDRMVSLFQEGKNGPPIFLVSIRAGGTGLNLTRANHVFHFDRWWNPAVEDQATDRTFRIGQTRNVQVHKFICSGTLEEQIDLLIEKKKSLAQSIIGSGEDWITELSTEDLRDMITLRRDDALSADET